MLSVIQANLLASGYRALNAASSSGADHRPGYEAVRRTSENGATVARVYTTNANGTQVRVVISHEELEGHHLDRRA